MYINVYMTKAVSFKSQNLNTSTFNKKWTIWKAILFARLSKAIFLLSTKLYELIFKSGYTFTNNVYSTKTVNANEIVNRS